MADGTPIDFRQDRHALGTPDPHLVAGPVRRLIFRFSP
jgi:hypothetical protein